VPSIFTVAPRGTVKDPIEGFTPNLVVTVLKVTGIVALLEEVLKANTDKDLNLLKKVIGFNLAMRVINNP
jgi:hypothetical protein